MKTVTKKKATKKKAPPKRPARAKRPAPAKKKRPARAPAPRVRGVPKENPEALALARRLSHLLLDKKANEVVILDVRGIASYADYVVIASGESDRQVAAMAEHVQTRLKQDDRISALSSEGEQTGQWVLLDYGDVVAHLFYGEVRGHYDLEGLFADAAREAVR